MRGFAGAPDTTELKNSAPCSAADHAGAAFKALRWEPSEAAYGLGQAHRPWG